MGRYLPRDYEPIHDALLRPGADLVDATRRVARNQNWIWANQGALVAAFGHEPMAAQVPTAVGESWVHCADFAAPNASLTGATNVRVLAYVNVSGTLTTVNAQLALYQLLPGEVGVTADSPLDVSAPITQAGGRVLVSIVARVRSGADPLRFALYVSGHGTATYTLESATVLWEEEQLSVLGESVGSWMAISQGFVAANRAASAALLRALSNRTLGLIAGNPRPIFAHSFLWPRLSALSASADVATWIVRTSSLQPAPWVTVRPRFLVTGQGAKFRAYVKVRQAGTINAYATADGTVFGTTALSNGAYVGEATDAIRIQLPAGSYVEIVAGLTTAGGGAISTDTVSSYPAYVGATLLGCTITQDAPTAATLGLPGADTIPAAYQPLDDLACAPRAPVVAQNDRVGRRAGPYYLVRNLIWLAANRSAHTLVADWVHRSQHAGDGTSTPGDGLHRNGTVFQYNAPAAGAWQPAPGGLPGIVGWADRAAPTNANRLDASGSPGGAGHHYPGDLLMKLDGSPLSGGKLGGLVLTETQFVPGSPYPAAKLGATLKFAIQGLSDPLALLQNVHLADTVAPGPIREWASLAAARGLRFGASTPNLRLAAEAYEATHHGLQVSLLSAYFYELPLTQADLDALA